MQYTYEKLVRLIHVAANQKDTNQLFQALSMGNHKISRSDLY